jgi:CHAT domain-containing protein
MDEQRKEGYLNLIQTLLQSSQGEEPSILNDRQDLIDAGLVETMKQVAATLVEQGDEDNAVFLRNAAAAISSIIGQPSLAETPIELLLMVLQAVRNSEADSQVVYPILQANIDKLDDEFPKILKAWATNILSEEELIPSEFLAQDIYNFSNRIAHFSFGSQAINQEIAIAGYEVAQTVFTPETFPEEWATVHNSIAAIYIKRIRGNKAENLEFAIAALQTALQVCNLDTFPQEWAITQNNLGAAYIKRIRDDKAENLELAINALQAALQVRTQDAYPKKWAMIQNNLAVAYRNRIRGSKAENLELAIAACQSALKVFTLEAFPQEWAETQDNLGNTFRSRLKGDNTENIELAIASYQAALKVFTQIDFSKNWAEVQNNLGLAYLERTQGDRAENIELAIDAFKSTLNLYSDEVFFEEWARTQNNLGIAYLDRICGNKSENLELAITAFQAALQVRTRIDFPEDWAMTQSNLGIAYGERFKGNKEKNLELAITAFQAALQVRTQEAFPEDWAITHSNLGHIYNWHGYVIKSIESFQLALEIYKQNVLPLDCFWTGRNLGNTAFTVGLWKIAIQGYAAAINAVEQSRTWATSESRRQEILAEAIDVYQNMVQACINDGQLEKAIEYVERSRSKRLVDLMASNDLYQSGEIPPEVKELLQQFDDLQQQIDQERSQNNSSNNRELMGVGTSTLDRATFQAYNKVIAALEAEKLQIWEQLRYLDPVLAGEIKVDAPNFVQMQKLIDQPTSAILSFYTTAKALHIFILRQHQITLHTCPNQGIEPPQGWISQNWLQPYAASCHPNRPKSEREQLRAEWISQISPFLTELAQRLQLTDLIAKHLNGIEELIVVPHLLLHQIPFAALPIQDPEYGYLGDKFLIRYTPSCQVLEFCKQRGEVTENFTYGTVEDATNDLPFASFEGEQIAQLHQISSERRLRGSSRATRDNYRQLAQKVQVLHSCHHAESCLDEPLNSQLKLGDGSITLGQLMSPGWRLPNLSDVFLSCCETGLGLPEITDDILTLSTGFLCAGARSVVSTLWAVNDLATAIFSIFYYQHRQQGCSRPEAVRQAQIKLRELKKEELLNREDIKELFRQAEAGEKEAIGQRKQYLPGSTERLKWDREYSKYAKVTKQIRSVKDSQAEEPFSHPSYWAAFTCSGLR